MAVRCSIGGDPMSTTMVVNLTVPRSLNRALRAAAKRESRSLAGFIVTRLVKSLEGDDDGTFSATS